MTGGEGESLLYLFFPLYLCIFLYCNLNRPSAVLLTEISEICYGPVSETFKQKGFVKVFKSLLLS